MNRHELYDRISTWNSMFEQIEIPPSRVPEIEAIRQRVKAQTNEARLCAVAQMEVPEELVGTVLENDLRTAIAYARATDPSKLNEIHDMLIKVQKYMRNNFKIVQ